MYLLDSKLKSSLMKCSENYDFHKGVRNETREWVEELECERNAGENIVCISLCRPKKLTAILLLCLQIGNVHIQSIKHKWFGCRCLCVCHHFKSNKCWWLLMWWFVFGKHAAYRLVSNREIYFYSQFRFIFICRHIWAFFAVFFFLNEFVRQNVEWFDDLFTMLFSSYISTWIGLWVLVCVCVRCCCYCSHRARKINLSVPWPNNDW